MSIEYEGRRPYEKPRKLTELGVQDSYRDNSPPPSDVDPEKDAIDQLFSRLAKTYLKGKSLKAGLGNMNPAQFIIIEDDATETAASARRLSAEQSKDGTVISYSLFQLAVDTIIRKKKILKGTVLNGSIPATKRGASRKTVKDLGTENGKIANLFLEFLAENGIVATLFGVLTMSPFQGAIFQALGVENGAKGIQAAQWAPGIVILLELGLKAAAILEALDAANIDIQPLQDQITRLENDPEARREALGQIGIDPDDLNKSQEYQDSENLVEYTVEYYKRYGGLDRPNGYLTIDHWIAYMQVAQNQENVKSALNTAPTFSPKFRDIEARTRPGGFERQPDIFAPADQDIDLGLDVTPMLNQFGSSARLLQETSDTVYSDIIATFNYRLTDKDLCCLVQIFGKVVNPAILNNIAVILRILATSLGEFIARIASITAAFLASIAQDILFEIVATLNKFYSKVVTKILDIFTLDLKYLTACNGMFTLGYAIIESVNALFDQIMGIIKDINKIILDFGSQGVDINLAGTGWVGAAERRFLLGTARLLEVISRRFALANSCDIIVPDTNITTQLEPVADQRIDAALINIIEELPPVLEIPEEQLNKYFDDEDLKTSDRLKFTYGIESVQNNETAEDGPCVEEQTQEKLDELLKSLQNAINTTFNG